MEYIPDNCFTIADAKRGDIGNTSALYAKAFFEKMNFNSITVSPYMGKDSITPFLEFENKWAIILALTSNQGADDFQMQQTANGELYKQVIKTSSQWGNINNIMYVVGATRPDYVKTIREIIPDHFLLIPGVGAQGGSLHDISLNGLNKDCGLLVNLSRQIIYASAENDFALKARSASSSIQNEMEQFLESSFLKIST
jgi:orotidine-5'-phosphate decarboxylase